jgi:hypothetical protein
MLMLRPMTIALVAERTPGTLGVSGSPARD